MTASDTAFYHPAPRTQRYCSQCGHALSRKIPPDDNRIRDLCVHCGAVHYQNPRNVVGIVPILGEQVLLCRRAIEPRHGKWTLPAGFMELDETLAEGAARETVEESGAEFDMGPLFSALSVPRVGQVHFFFLATLRSAALDPGPESLEAALFREADIPWDELAFATIERTLRLFLADRQGGYFGMHTCDIVPLVKL